MALPLHETRDEPSRVRASPGVWARPSAEERVKFAGEMQYSERSSGCGLGMGVSRGKGKESNPHFLEQDDDGEDEDDEDTIENHGGSSHEVYPPTTDAATETRRVEEGKQTLKRWELAERQRRKLARESSQMSTGQSLLGDVTRKASLILSRHTAPSHRRTSVGGMAMGNHQALKSRESVDGYVVPLDEIDPNSPSAIPVHSPTPSVLRNSASSESQNPFIHPSESLSRPSPSPSPPLVSPFIDTKERTSVTSGSAIPRAPSSSLERTGISASTTDKMTPTRPTTLPSSKTLVPPPLPLGLPPPVTPPPPGEAPQMVPLRPTPPPALSPPPPSLVEPEERREVRWWHDWLCGCGEGSDRGGDSQAGRTNPFE
ncbi:hypothetical protein F5I97DRAFT_719958 [Phlebopus sp. FC_14]|nr:hypothetical protein F5I97DRAFT_719958 [Phlebopus sp. FC_14]